MNTLLDATSAGGLIDLSYYLLKLFNIQLRTIHLGHVIPKIVNTYGDRNISLNIINKAFSELKFIGEFGRDAGIVELDMNFVLIIKIEEDTIL